MLYQDTPAGGVNNIYLGSKLIAKDGFIPNPGGTQNHRPYGSSIEGEADDIGYTGHKFDTDLGLSYMQARYYDPVIGRFYSNDPVDALSHLSTPNGIHGFNRYAYANNNPYRYIDPTGMSSQNVIPTYLKGKSAEEIGEMLKEEKSKPKNQQNKQKIRDLQKAQKGLGVRNKQKRKNIRRGGGRGAAVVAILGLVVDLFTDNEAEASENDDTTPEPNEQNEEDREETPEPKEPPKKEEKT
ncbi:RHS repeat-associated core domain-containing protein [Aestuariibacter sp. AA17]|uniref:RHS repeat-associated core domain-containing protein n=1 Tax=Fluctibacter corallii TaxID=2984329 RepID=A0ABT3ACU8_9ALTE|nr:RHS repeat-associated core domain-containing protein [Aestuariibacter sp. AA17]MCV2886497.1 RHS repeat-associated core domain-containing protein [Aestuariibacter sp. AA17]